MKRFNKEYLEKICDTLVLRVESETVKGWFSDKTIEKVIKIDKNNISQPVWDMCLKFLNEEVELIFDYSFITTEVFDLTNNILYSVDHLCAIERAPIVTNLYWTTKDEDLLLGRVLYNLSRGISYTFVDDKMVDENKIDFVKQKQDMDRQERERFTKLYGD